MFVKLFLICLLIGINYSNCLQLEKLCSKSLFVYKNLECNSIHRIKLTRTFPEVRFFVIDEIDYRGGYFNSTEKAEQMKVIKNTYNEKIMNIYNDYYINTKEYKNIWNDYQIIKSGYESVINDLVKFVDHKYLSTFNKYTLNAMKKGLEFSRLLAYNYINQFDIENDTDSVYNLKKELDDLELNENITGGFQNDHIDRIHKLPILMKPVFNFRRHSKVYYNLESNGTLISDIIIPVNDSNYVNVTSDCLDLDKLPKFYEQFKK